MDRPEEDRKIIFISDVHLAAEEPERTERFFSFIERHRPDMGQLYILGDLFDFWIGPRSARLPEFAKVLSLLKQLVADGIPVTYIAGNRDFFGVRDFERTLGVKVFTESNIIELGGRRVLLTHGDLFQIRKGRLKPGRCFWLHPFIERLYLRFPSWLANYIGTSYARKHRRSGENAHRGIFAFPVEMYAGLFNGGVDVVICGHTHQSRKIVFPPDEARSQGNEKVLYSIGCWYNDTPYLEYADGEFELKSDDEGSS